ncbi:hypothetical protein SD70_26870 [Gordoniibacillus kamchatkensis]|uniref:Prepilin type IV endopeptidase peptidase domain-containing protein n=1 Tax=Gordoniibacillus kamchatkensis TaxID=1590651 RepID=A0ABR5ABD0_9BACL|nr:hypothetical protein SD70_26870 [Paenibacillus sp. VKM B-2647]
MGYNALLTALLAVSAATDIKSRKIYNKTLLPAWIAALVLHVWLEGWHGAATSLLGCAAGLGVLLVPYLMGGMGAGDVKLLAVVGAIKGTGFVLLASLGMALLGGVMACAVIAMQAGARRQLVWFVYWGYSLRCGFLLPLRPGGESGGVQAGRLTYPYGVAIAGGAALGVWLEQSGWGW